MSKDETTCLLEYMLARSETGQGPIRCRKRSGDILIKTHICFNNKIYASCIQKAWYVIKSVNIHFQHFLFSFSLTGYLCGKNYFHSQLKLHIKSE